MASRIYHQERDIKIVFTNPKTHERLEKVFSKKSNKEAVNYANDLDFEFYSENTSFIPEGISVERGAKRFRLYVRLSGDTGKDYPKIIFSNKLLIKVIEARAAVIKTLTGIGRF